MLKSDKLDAYVYNDGELVELQFWKGNCTLHTKARDLHWAINVELLPEDLERSDLMEAISPAAQVLSTAGRGARAAH